MRKFMISAAVMTAFAALLGSAPSKAEYNYGATRNGNQCWTSAISHGRDGFGFWRACPQPASLVTTPSAQRRRHR